MLFLLALLALAAIYYLGLCPAFLLTSHTLNTLQARKRSRRLARNQQRAADILARHTYKPQEG